MIHLLSSVCAMLSFIELLEEKREPAEHERGTCGHPFVLNGYVAPIYNMFDSDGNLLYGQATTGIILQQPAGKFLESSSPVISHTTAGSHICPSPGCLTEILVDAVEQII